MIYLYNKNCEQECIITNGIMYSELPSIFDILKEKKKVRVIYKKRRC